MISSAIPYCGPAPVPSDWLAQWNMDPVLIGALGLLGWGLAKAGAPRQSWLGLAGLVLLFVSPLCALSSALFSARVGHHVLLTALIAPLLALPISRRMGGTLPWTGLHMVIFWFWHAPQPYGAALSNDLVFWIMQISLLGSATGLWAAILRAPAPAAIAALLATSVQMGLLGALLTFGLTQFYAPHALTTLAWGLTPLEDQQLAGLLMWVGGSALYLGAALLVGWRWLDPARAKAAA